MAACVGVKTGLQLLARYAHYTRLHNLAAVPTAGRTVVATNHAGVRGALLLGAHLKREVVFVGSARFLSAPVAASIARNMDDILVSPGDMLGTRMLDACAAVLARGALLGIMTEGRLMNGRYGPPKRGAAYLAARLHADLLPVHIQLRGPFAQVSVAAPLSVGPAVDRVSLEAVTQQLAQRLEEARCVF
jgi:1-acyl-sn-glycerol-3-phosphate acyltransferase